MLPTRHAYAALLLEQGDVKDAAKAYSENMGLDLSLTRSHQHPNSVWVLHGYHECLVRLGRRAKAAIIKQPLKIALSVADIDIKMSCFCRWRVQKAEQPGCCE